ncbi:hypothetical protein OPV22_018183 [Ensete ventricosum]|uniref:Pectate lyase superfamily protein domain-containing protein n=1 Tax=Ensete ventricosum TaxID=4639 RepID=A0AAV8QYZ8_ENSVE|nr:hypothetical protein OPV22_018183 [Ensete ventricosum]
MVKQGRVNSLVILVLACFVAGCVAASSSYSVTDFGAKGDGVTDDTKAFLDTWNATCQSSVSSVLFIPAGKTFLLNPIVFHGPCKFYIRVQVDGDIIRPGKLWGGNFAHWLLFSHIDQLSIVGSGKIDGQGAAWWSCKTNHVSFSSSPLSCFCLRQSHVSAVSSSCFLHAFTSFGFFRSNAQPVPTAQVAGLRLISSPQMHLVVGFSSAVRITGLTITAPGDSLNTDGVHIEQSRDVVVSDSTIGTGDDCISIGTGSILVNVSRVTCGPGHGISIGSLGMANSLAQVSDIQGGYGYAKNIIFESINLTAVMNPIIIDQHYCANNVCAEQRSAVQVSDVRFIDVRGTSSSQVAINLNCSQNVACTGITFHNVEIQPAQRGGQASSYCFNAHGTVTGIAIPAVPCLMP